MREIGLTVDGVTASRSRYGLMADAIFGTLDASIVAVVFMLKPVKVEHYVRLSPQVTLEPL